MNYLTELADSLKSTVRVGVPQVRNDIGYLPYTRVAKFEVVRALRNLGYKPYSLNPNVLIQRGGRNPVTVNDETIVLLAPKIMPWKKLADVATVSDLSFAHNPLGTAKIQGMTKSQIRELGLVSEGGRFFYPLDFSGAVEQKTAPIEAPVHRPEPEVRQEMSPELRKFGLSSKALQALSNCTETSSRTVLLAMLKMMWRELNHVKFNNRLQEPNFKLIPNKGSRMRVRAYWSPRRRLIAVSPRLFNARPEVLLEIFLHEMCHQATSEISKVHDEPNQGHGPVWEGWMIHVGLDPSRYDRHSNDEYESPEVRPIFDYVKSHQLPLKYRARFVQCAVLMKDRKIRECVIVEVEFDDKFNIYTIAVHDGRTYRIRERKGQPSALCWLPKYRWDSGLSVNAYAGPK